MENQVRKNLSDNLKRLMKEHNVDQKELAEAIGVSQPTISNWIKQTKYPRIKKIQDLADYFNVPKSKITENQNIQQETIAAHFDKEDLTEEEMEEVRQFIEFIKNRKK
ncbi:TPA: helix-turn-helix transcriptional regulator [Staphylococcus pseudintermedius]|uniref:helix-turn-helix domain-containing protein n=1 Tax=Staphylococcus pseudintermedius TaxID=283734 RepID=UPI00109D205C|nr:helix-turn-helix transcriptional regulator [Staphylococcus pseudintermedius]EGQ2779152.1 helix-turn-helix transcriptional regulator [Staphylococcus pseudintermedius]EGQ3341425.1 helix-turn-helix transcriptional regulator [Staphylococcus pseudintermedius]EGQ4043539.1 helix-turn-helix domain-containing protein [Staphylococcus pseudintermedius]EGQ4244781.1 helix-turn-helix transcriptional regulator [Staphylococcus pseudintermedius]EJG5108203.1 helix-turn-helix transcriptional regulator [Staphy